MVVGLRREPLRWQVRGEPGSQRAARTQDTVRGASRGHVPQVCASGWERGLAWPARRSERVPGTCLRVRSEEGIMTGCRTRLYGPLLWGSCRTAAVGAGVLGPSCPAAPRHPVVPTSSGSPLPFALWRAPFPVLAGVHPG